MIKRLRDILEVIRITSEYSIPLTLTDILVMLFGKAAK